MIIVGYQGIGKSSVAGTHNCIDLESGNFWVNGKRSDDWYIPYCQIANHLSEQGYTVFTSSHEVVRKELENSKEQVFVVFPSFELRDEWIKRLQDRYNRTKLEKDYKALMNAVDRYDQNIMELKNSKFDSVIIDYINYDLTEIVTQLQDYYKK